jgi:hypothetical protein
MLINDLLASVIGAEKAAASKFSQGERTAWSEAGDAD